MPKEIDAIIKLYDYVLWMIPKLERFPRSQKFILADRIETLMLDILDLLIEAAYTRNKRRLLLSANLNLEKLRYLVRISKDLKLINIKSYEYSARAVDGIGRSIGGWLKYVQNKSRIYRVSDGVRFLGYRVFPTHRLVTKDNALRMRRRLKKLSRQYREGQIALDQIHQSIQSWIGHVCHADSYHLRSRLFGSVAFQRGEAGDAPGRLLERQPR